MEIKQTNTPPPKLNGQFRKYRCDQVTFIKILPKHPMEQQRETSFTPEKHSKELPWQKSSKTQGCKQPQGCMVNIRVPLRVSLRFNF